MDYWVIVSLYNREEHTVQSELFATPYQAERKRLIYEKHAAAYHRAYETFIVRPATWQEREERMFTAEVYQPPVWHTEKFWDEWGRFFKEHFVHISLNDPTGVAYTEDARKGEADRQTHIRPGKYLQRFLGAGADGLIEYGPLKGQEAKITKQQIAFYSSWHSSGNRPFTDDVLAFAEDEDEIVRVYEDGPKSCMQGGCWNDEDHPVRVYAGGGLAVAYLTSVSGDVIGRALCWPAKQVFGRVYPTPEGHYSRPGDREKYDQMMARLKALGWTSITERSNVLNGALLRNLTDCGGDTIMPYLDNDYGVREVHHEGQWWWAMDRDEHHQCNTDGTYCHPDDDEPSYDWSCDHCDEGMYDDSDRYTVYRRWRSDPTPSRPGRGWGYGEMSYCQSCYDYNTFYCEGSEEHYDDSHTEQIQCGHNSYERNYFFANGGYQCSWSDEFFLADEETPIALANGAVVAECNVEEASFVCLWDGQRWPKDYASEVVPGYSCNADCLDVHPCQFEFVLPDVPDEETVLAMALRPPPPWGFDPTCYSLLDPIVAEVFGLTPNGPLPIPDHIPPIFVPGGNPPIPAPRPWPEAVNS